MARATFRCSGRLLKTLLSLLSDFSITTVLHVTLDGLKLWGLDPSHVVGVELDWMPWDYEVDEEFDVGVDDALGVNLLRYARGVRVRDVVEVEITPEKMRVGTFTARIPEYKIEEPPRLKLRFDAEACVEVAGFRKFVQACPKEGYVAIRVRDGVLDVGCDGKFVSIAPWVMWASGEAVSAFNLSYLSRLLIVAKDVIEPTAIASFINKGPICIKYTIEEGLSPGLLRVCLAPVAEEMLSEERVREILTPPRPAPRIFLIEDDKLIREVQRILRAVSREVDEVRVCYEWGAYLHFYNWIYGMRESVFDLSVDTVGAMERRRDFCGRVDTSELVKMMEDAREFWAEERDGKVCLCTRTVTGDVRRKDIPEYGMFSTRELITNAVCHRNYEDQGGKIIIKVCVHSEATVLGSPACKCKYLIS